MRSGESSADVVFSGSPTQLAGKVYIVAGATGGIGGAVARALARCGAQLLLTGRDMRRLRSLADALAALGRSADDVELISADLRERAAATVLIGRAAERFGRLDGVINAAGVGQLGRFLEVPAEDHLTQLGTNVEIAVRLSHASMEPLMRHRGIFVQVVSGLSSTVRKEAVVYGASQHAIAGLIQGLRAEVGGRGARLTLVSVGGAGVDTGFWDVALPRVDRKGMMGAAQVAATVLHAVTAPGSVQMDELRLRTP